MSTITRLPDVRTLAEILPKGAEGGKEFARIVDLLIFYSANRLGQSVNLFSDRSGDYFGLDSVQEFSLRRERAIGYQYKFFPSPLSTQHRAEIVASLKKALENQNELKLKRWILVTPDDLSESALKKGGGDVSWFASLRSLFRAKFEIEHWGHRKLQALFIETPRLCLYYYPELVPNGANKKKTILEIRKIYDRNIVDINNRIEFIGMSVYKPEATHGVPMEDIYIPVSVVPYLDSGSPLKASRTNPLSFLAPGSRHVILGDPGSGKSTLLKFLLLAGQSERLQGRYRSSSDTRLPLLITLRKYGDELKQNKNISLIDYICQVIQADLSIPEADIEFLQFYLESGQAIILFDGMDELPAANFKQMVRDRISSFLSTYPLVTAIVTSRIVGYNPAFGFSQKVFSHYQVAPLLMDEIECFIRDWYTARIENLQIRENNITDLLRILKNPDAVAIRTLAENPLLLTIVALVHRIDAVLPDERVVLYQKCTETLLNTWHVWKYKAGEDLTRRGRVERTNRRRIETLALYMHTKSGELSKKSRAVLSESELLSVLTTDILHHDDVADVEDARDIACDFLDFVKQKAGLLIEVGNNEYSFIHLTFQEYLAATCLSVTVEMNGVRALWGTLFAHISDPRWHEVIRLLIAGLKSDDSQAYLVSETLKLANSQSETGIATLLGGLLIDGVKSAERCSVDIISTLFKQLNSTSEDENIANVISLLQTLSSKYIDAWDEAFKQIWSSTPQVRRAMLLLVIGSEIPETRWDGLTEPKDLSCCRADVQTFSLLLGTSKIQEELDPEIQFKLNDYHNRLIRSSHRNRIANFIAYIGQSVFSYCDEEQRARYWLELQFNVFRTLSGPFNDLYYNSTLFSFTLGSPPTLLQLAQIEATKKDRHNRNRLRGLRAKNNVSAKGAPQINRDFEKKILAAASRGNQLFPVRMVSKKGRNYKSDLKSSWDIFSEINDARPIFEDSFNQFIEDTVECLTHCDNDYLITLSQRWTKAVSTHELLANFSAATIETFDLSPFGLWKQAIQARFLSNLLSRLPRFDCSELFRLEHAFSGSIFNERDILSAASFHLYDVWLYVFGGYSAEPSSPIFKLAELTNKINNPYLEIAREIRSLALSEVLLEES